MRPFRLNEKGKPIHYIERNGRTYCSDWIYHQNSFVYQYSPLDYSCLRIIDRLKDGDLNLMVWDYVKNNWVRLITVYYDYLDWDDDDDMFWTLPNGYVIEKEHIFCSMCDLAKVLGFEFK